MHKPLPPQVPLTFARKAARPLFALLAPATFAACASGVGAAQASFPLCDGAGAPACGNIGQAGRQGTPAPPDASRTTLQATPRVAAQGFPMFEVATTTLAAVGVGVAVAATTLSVLIVSEWGDAPEHEPTMPATPAMPATPTMRATPTAPVAPTPSVAIAVVPPAPVRQLVEVASVRVLPANDEEVDKLDSQEDKCKDDQVNRPVVDGDYRPACGNVMTKGGHKRGRR